MDMNAGTRALDWLFTEQLKVDRHWAVRSPTGFQWWADKQAQTVEVIGEMEGGPDGAVGYVVRVQTDVLRGVELDEPGLFVLNNEIMSFPSMAGLVYDEEAHTLSFSSLARVWDQNEAWLDPFIAMAAVLQIGEARMLAPQLATQLDAEVAISGHPDHGLRAQPDEMADAIESLVIPTGKGGSVWGAEEFESAVRESVSGPVAVSASPDGDGFHVEVPFGDVPSRCQVLPGTGHPVYGAGLLIMQQLPVTPPTDAEGAGFALALNAIELSQEPFGYGFGSYACRDRCMYFISFFPNALYRRGVLPNLVVSCAQRARSLRGLLELGDEETTEAD
jgi:hypothetical protein